MLIPIVMGTTIFAYIHCFNRIAHEYKKSGYTLDWNDLISVLRSSG